MRSPGLIIGRKTMSCLAGRFRYWTDGMLIQEDIDGKFL